MLLDVSQRLVNETDVRRLGLQLKVPQYVIDSKVNEYKIVDAAYHVLKFWFNNQRDRAIAYQVLGKALVDVQLNIIAGEVLDYPSDL